MITFDDIRESYKAEVGDDDEFEYGVLHDDFYGDKENKWTVDHGYELLERVGGGEGGAEECHSAFKLDGKIYRMDYSYMSYNGYNFDGVFKEVHPVEKTVTVYE